MLRELQTEMLFNSDGTINYDIADRHLKSLMLPNMTELNKETIVLDVASETLLPPQILEMYFERFSFDKLVLNNKIPFNLVINHRQYIIDQLLRSLIFDQGDYVKQYIENHDLKKHGKMAVLYKFISYFDFQDAIFEDIFKEIYNELKDLYMSGYHTGMTTPGEFLYFSNRFMIKLFYLEFIYHHRVLFDSVMILTWFPYYEKMADSWMIANWITDRDLRHAIRVILKEYRLQQANGEDTKSLSMQALTQRLFYFKTMLHRRKVNN